MSSDLFWSLGLQLMKLSPQGSLVVRQRAWKEHFGQNPNVCEYVWIRLTDQAENGSEPKHLLFALFFLRNYQTEMCNHTFSGLDPKTFRKWSFHWIELIAFNLDVVKD